MEIEVTSMMDKGKTRDINEDFVLLHKHFGLFMLADGMGGYDCGDKASKMSLESVIEYFQKYTNGESQYTEAQMRAAIDYSNQKILQYKRKDEKVEKMGTTFIAASIEKKGLRIFYIGDSRAYLFRDNEFKQLSVDHSLEQEVLPEFMKDAGGGKFSSMLSRALGTDEMVWADTVETDLKMNDQILLCSDGLYSMVNDDEIQSTLNQNDITINEKLKNLIQSANDHGGEDNISIILMKVIDDKSAEDTQISIQ